MASLEKRARRRLNTLLRSMIVALVMAGIYAIIQQNGGAETLQSATSTPPGSYRVLDAADGDTINVSMDGVRERVRLVGVDTPETHHPSKPAQCYGPEASKFTADLVNGKDVRLRSDTQQPNRDRYGRLLRYVYLPDGRELNELLVTTGHAFAGDFDTEKKAQLKQLQQAAEQQRSGLWGACTIKRDGRYLQTNDL